MTWFDGGATLNLRSLASATGESFLAAISAAGGQGIRVTDGVDQQDEDRECDSAMAIASAMADPLRSKLLMAVGDASKGASVKQLAARIGEPERRTRYHLDALAKQGLVAVAREQGRRGVVERYYRQIISNVISVETHEAVGPLISRKIFFHVLKAILDDAGAAVSAGTFGARPDCAFLRIPGQVDHQGWEELAAIYLRTLDEIQATLAEATRRLSDGEEEGIDLVASLLLFDVPPWPGFP